MELADKLTDFDFLETKCRATSVYFGRDRSDFSQAVWPITITNQPALRNQLSTRGVPGTAVRAEGFPGTLTRRDRSKQLDQFACVR
jgi:hypothetical protein